MTEKEWLNCTEPTPMLEFLRGKASDRKLRLFACACCRRVWDQLPDERCRQAVLVAERFADGMATDLQLRSAADAAFQSADDNSSAIAGQSFAIGQGIYFAARTASYAANPSPHEAAFRSARTMHTAAVGTAGEQLPARLAAHDAVCHYRIKLLDDIFGNPFRPVALDPNWLTSAVVEMAQTIYDDRTFNRLPNLADALDESGCDNEEILNHCRQPGVHVRGCWVLDLLLGKE
jgi:hypothetical protein